jgi:hypothetical protein
MSQDIRCQKPPLACQRRPAPPPDRSPDDESCRAGWSIHRKDATVSALAPAAAYGIVRGVPEDAG